ncbi:MAG: hypothetical protein IIA61_07945 [Candidatus Marinimicrobia bacterium]|nr:hypothetical protein [Candidatus Neomarinimicrobiota bacterium]
MDSLKSDISPTDQSQFVQGNNSWSRTDYGGPYPHRYFFTLNALDVKSLDLSSSSIPKHFK